MSTNLPLATTSKRLRLYLMMDYQNKSKIISVCNILQSDSYLALVIEFLNIKDVFSKVNKLSMYHSSFIFAFNRKYLLKLLLVYHYNVKLLDYPYIKDIFNKNKNDYNPKGFIRRFFTDFKYFKSLLSIQNSDTSKKYNLEILVRFKNSKCLLHWIKYLSQRALEDDNDCNVTVICRDLCISKKPEHRRYLLLNCCDFVLWDFKEVFYYEVLHAGNVTKYTWFSASLSLVFLELLLRDRINVLKWCLNEILIIQNTKYAVNVSVYFKYIFRGLLFRFGYLPPNNKWNQKFLSIEKYNKNKINGRNLTVYGLMSPSFNKDWTYDMVNQGLDNIQHNEICKSIINMSYKLVNINNPDWYMFILEDDFDDDYEFHNKLLATKVYDIVKDAIQDI